MAPDPPCHLRAGAKRANAGPCSNGKIVRMVTAGHSPEQVADCTAPFAGELGGEDGRGDLAPESPSVRVRGPLLAWALGRGEAFTLGTKTPRHQDQKYVNAVICKNEN